MNLNMLMSWNIHTFCFYFVIYAFLGWCVEVLYAYKNQKKFVNRGFLKGPFCPIYGFCISSMVLVLDNLSLGIIPLFFVATVVISTIEYITGLILEKLFKTKYWDYTEDPFNLHGRICLHFSLMWGGTSLLVAKIIHPVVESFVLSMNTYFSNIILLCLIMYFMWDVFKTISKLVDFQIDISNYPLLEKFINKVV